MFIADFYRLGYEEYLDSLAELPHYLNKISVFFKQ